MLALNLSVWIALHSATAVCTQDPELEESFASAVDQERLLRTVRELVAIGPRMGGTPSGDLAAKHHAQLFRDAGLEPQITVDPELRAFQPLECSARVTIGDETLELKDGALALRTMGIDATELPLRTTSSTPATGAENYARLVNEGELHGLEQLTGSKAPRVLLVACELCALRAKSDAEQRRALGRYQAETTREPGRVAARRVHLRIPPLDRSPAGGDSSPS